MRLSESLTDAYKVEYEDDGDLCLLINHAVALAREAEYDADHAANQAQTHVEPAYPPWITMLWIALRRV